MNAWNKLADDPQGHRLFRLAGPKGLASDGRVRLFVADRSGSTPDNTDDGRRGYLTEIDYIGTKMSGAVYLEPSHGFIVANLPTTDGKRVHLSPRCAVEVAALWRLPMTLVIEKVKSTSYGGDGLAIHREKRATLNVIVPEESNDCASDDSDNDSIICAIFGEARQ